MEEKNATLLKFSGFPLFQILGRKLPFHPLLNSQSSRSGPKYMDYFCIIIFRLQLHQHFFQRLPRLEIGLIPKTEVAM